MGGEKCQVQLHAIGKLCIDNLFIKARICFKFSTNNYMVFINIPCDISTIHLAREIRAIYFLTSGKWRRKLMNSHDKIHVNIVSSPRNAWEIYGLTPSTIVQFSTNDTQSGNKISIAWGKLKRNLVDLIWDLNNNLFSHQPQTSFCVAFLLHHHHAAPSRQ